MQDPRYFTEDCPDGGSAFSFHITKKLHEQKSAYQTVAIYDTTHFGKLMTIDGYVMLTTEDNFIYHEMMAHPVLFNHANPKDILIVGGGDCGTLQQVLKHKTVKTAVQVDIDELVTELSLEHFPELCTENNDPRAILLFEDALEWIRKAKTASLDVIIVDSTDPIGPAEGLFGESFYRDCSRVLRPGGLICQQSESPLYHLEKIIKPMHKSMKSAGFIAPKTLHFPQPSYPSGWWTATMACKDNEVEIAPEDTIVKRLDFPTKYYTPEGHHGAFSLPPFMGL